MEPAVKESLRDVIGAALNSACAENESNTPDYILAEYLMNCLEAFDAATAERDRWYGVHLEPGRKHFVEDDSATDSEPDAPKGG